MELILPRLGVPTLSLIDDDVYQKIKHKKWFVNNKGYAAARVDGKYALLHRYILGLGADDKCFVDHINCNRLDNRLSNLRTCTFTENIRNKPVYKNNVSGFKGVNRRINSDGSLSFRARIRCDKKLIQLGTYRTALEAALAYDAKALELFGEFAHLNFNQESKVG